MLWDTLLVVRDLGRVCLALLYVRGCQQAESHLERCSAFWAKYGQRGVIGLLGTKLCSLSHRLWWRCCGNIAHLDIGVNDDGRPCCGQ